MVEMSNSNPEILVSIQGCSSAKELKKKMLKQYEDLGQKCQALTGFPEPDREVSPEDLHCCSSVVLMPTHYLDIEWVLEEVLLLKVYGVHRAQLPSAEE